MTIKLNQTEAVSTATAIKAGETTAEMTDANPDLTQAVASIETNFGMQKTEDFSRKTAFDHTKYKEKGSLQLLNN